MIRSKGRVSLALPQRVGKPDEASGANTFGREETSSGSSASGAFVERVVGKGIGEAVENGRLAPLTAREAVSAIMQL